jgi:hypothetical protein
VRAGLGTTAGKAKDSSAPSPSIRGAPKRRPRAPPALPGKRPRVGGLFLLELLAASFQKGQAGVARTPSHPPPLGVFSITTAPFAPDWGKKRARRRRVAPDEGGAGDRSRDTYAAGNAVDPPRTPPTTATRGKKERPFVSEKGAGPEQGTVRRRERLPRHAIDALDPASTTPPPRREHHRSHLIPFLPP